MSLIKSIRKLFGKADCKDNETCSSSDDSVLSDRQARLVEKVKDIVNGKEGWELDRKALVTSLTCRLIYRNKHHDVSLEVYANGFNPGVCVTMRPDDYFKNDLRLDEAFVSKDLSEFLLEAHKRLQDECFDRCLDVLDD